MLFVRSALFNIAFYLNTIICVLLAAPTFVLPGWTVLEVAKTWGRINLWLLRVIANVKVEFVGIENIPPGPMMLASKHQSAWETFALMPLLARPTFILKRELLWIPGFGWLLWKGGMIPVDRDAGPRSMIKMLKRTCEQIPGQRRQLIIFPEGTRRSAGAEPQYKFGVAHIYAGLGVPCVPVALNSGLFWPRRSFLRYPGTIRVEIFKAIPPGLDKKEFFERLQSVIEEASDRLLIQGRREITEAGYTPV